MILEGPKRREGRVRSSASSKEFNEFIEKMQMEEIEHQGRNWTWANNWKEEGFIEESWIDSLALLIG